ncbi:MAG: lysylphosphatidylglycerol synthase transmembrane domain-containing protein [bacterium]
MSIKFGIPINMRILEPKYSKIAAPSLSAQTAHKDYGSIFKSRALFWGKVGFALLALYFLIKSIQAATLLEVLKTAKWNYLALAIFLVIPNIGIQVFKWHYLLKLANPATSFSNSFKSLLVGYPLGIFTPGRLGEIGRAFFVQEIHQIKTLKLVIIDKITNLFITFLFGLVGILFLTQNHYRLILQTALLIYTGTLLCPILFPSINKLIFRRFTEINIFGRKEYIILLCFSTLFYSIFLGQFLNLILSFQVVNPITASGAAASVFLVKTILPISIGDLGIREGASVFIFDKIGLAAAQAFNASILLFLINIGIPTLIGLWILLKK